jgi:hypothetical protein
MADPITTAATGDRGVAGMPEIGAKMRQMIGETDVDHSGEHGRQAITKQQVTARKNVRLF